MNKHWPQRLKSCICLILAMVCYPALAERLTTQTYTAQGQVASVDGPRTDVTDITTYEYDAQGNRIRIINALGHTTEITAHDASGRPLTIIDPNGQATQLDYDPRGRLTTRTEAGKTTRYSYDAVGNLLRVTQPDNSYLANTYDAARRLIAIEDSLGNHIDYTLDAMGNRLSEENSDATGLLTRTRDAVYDQLGRLIEIIDGNDQSTQYSYDPNGNQIGMLDARLNATAQQYDALNQLQTVTDPLEGLTEYTYDPQDNLQSVTDPNGNTTHYSYDGLGNLLELQSPDTGITTYTYDTAGNRLTRTDARGITTSYTYDALNRVVTIEVPTLAEHVSFEYDQGLNGIGRLTRMTDESGIIDYTYDARGNLITESKMVDGVRYTTGYAYDAADLLQGITYPSGTVVSYTRDVMGHIASVSTTEDGVTTTEDGVTTLLASDIEYLPFGPMKALTFGNGLALTRSFGPDYRLTGQTTGTLQDFGYTLDPAGNITVITDGLDPGRDQSFAYDAQHRLIGARGVYGVHAYGYDAVGNRLNQSADGITDDYTYATGSNRLLDVIGPNGESLDYDASGNTLTKGTFDFSYNDTNRLSETLSGSQVIASYIYNGKGERVKKSADGKTRVFHYDQSGNLIAETDEAGNTLTEYLYLEGLRLAVLAPTTTGNSTPIEVDNSDAGVTLIGDWPVSTMVSGYTGVNYQYHTPNGVPVGGQVIDNGSAGFSVTGTWPTSTSVSGYEGGHYQYHAANGASPDGAVIDNGDAGTNTIGTWETSTSVGSYEGSHYLFHAAGNGANHFTWTLDPATAGDYNVYARWTAHANRAGNATYTVTHANGSTAVTVNQKQNGGQWRLLGTFTLNAGSGAVVLTDEADGYVIADAIKVEPIDAAPNTATWTTTLSEAGEHHVYARWTAHPNRATDATYTVIHPGGSDTITVNQQQNGDQWNLLGTFIFDAGTARIELTDQADGYVIADAIQLVPTDAAYNRVTWSADLAQDGAYEVYANWTAHPNRATNATYTVHHANGNDTVTVNQQVDSGQWNLLGTFDFAAGVGQIELSDQANGYVIVDAIRFTPLSTTASGPAELYYVHTDHLGTPQILTDENRQIVWQADYEPFGTAQVTIENVTNNIRFPGQYYDEETGLHYNYFRYYDPTTGRYITSDPIGLIGGINTYIYVGANPIMNIDPNGLDYWIEGQGSSEGGYGAHQSFCVGRFFGSTGISRHCIAFGVMPDDREDCTWYGSCRGTVYTDTSETGPIVEGSHVATSEKVDKQIMEYINWYLWATGDYNIGINNCRHFARRLWSEVNGRHW